jgi:predicted nucleotidyltransferase
VRHDAAPRDRVLAAAGDWVRELLANRPEVVQVGYFGSYARGDYAPGSDFDVLMEITRTALPPRDRAFAYLPDSFPVDLDLVVYTTDELAALRGRNAAFVAAIDRELTSLP